MRCGRKLRIMRIKRIKRIRKIRRIKIKNFVETIKSCIFAD